jgi:hypothetical protein
MICRALVLAGMLLASRSLVAAEKPIEQMAIPRVEMMPAVPMPFQMRDWRATARGFDALAFDLSATGEHLPLTRLVRDKKGRLLTFAMPPYVGETRGADNFAGVAFEGITCLGAVWGATLVGIDKSAGRVDYVRLCDYYFDKRPTRQIIGNHRAAEPGESFWYTLFPTIVYGAIADRYPQRPELTAHYATAALRWADAIESMRGADGSANFDHTGFDFDTMKPVDNGKWTEPDAAAALSWIQYTAHRRSGDSRTLAAASACLEALQARPREKNPSYEVLMPFGVLAAARMNAEHGTTYDVEKFMNWCFERSVARPDFAVVASRWDGVDVHGLVGAVNGTKRRPRDGGYAFAMNTFVTAWPLVPVARYDQRYARAIGRWMLNAANAARLFYPDGHPRERQTCPEWSGNRGNVVAYEGLKHYWDGDERLLAAGDPLKLKWGPKTDYGLYGSAYAGIFGAIVGRTSDPHVLALDLRATDTAFDKSYPTYLLYNPNAQTKIVTFDVGPARSDIYDTVSGVFLARNVVGSSKITIPRDAAVIVVLTPPDGKLIREHGRTRVDGVIIDYRRGT